MNIESHVCPILTMVWHIPQVKKDYIPDERLLDPVL